MRRFLKELRTWVLLYTAHVLFYVMCILTFVSVRRIVTYAAVLGGWVQAVIVSVVNAVVR